MSTQPPHSFVKREKDQQGLFACPCCGYATLATVGGFEICVLCFWEDDGQDDPQADPDFGGPNQGTLSAVRVHFIRSGAADKRALAAVRAPTPTDENLRNYRLFDGRKVTTKA